MYYTLIYNNLSINQKNKIKVFISSNFNIDFKNVGLEPNTIIILNYEENKIIGCVCLINNNDLEKKLEQSYVSKNYYNFKNTKGLFLYNLCVDEEHRNKKIGNKLIELSIELAKKSNIEYIHSQAENDISRSIFIKNNFSELKKFTSNVSSKWTYLMNLYI